MILNKQSILLRDEHVERYLNDIGRIPMLSKEETDKLFREYQKTKSIEIRNKLIEANLRFVVSSMKSFQTSGVPVSELIQYGNMGLIKAVEMYDTTKGFTLSSYAIWWIKQAKYVNISKFYDLIRIPYHIEKEYVKSLKENDVEKTNSEFNNIHNVKYIARLDRPVAEGDDLTLIDTISDETYSPQNELTTNSSNELLLKAIETLLSPKEQFIVKKFYGIDSDYTLSMESIAEELNYSKERIRQMIGVSLRKLRKHKKLLINA